MPNTYVVYTRDGRYVGTQTPTADAARRIFVQKGITEANSLPLATFESLKQANDELDTSVLFLPQD